MGVRGGIYRISAQAPPEVVKLHRTLFDTNPRQWRGLGTAGELVATLKSSLCVANWLSLPFDRAPYVPPMMCLLEQLPMGTEVPSWLATLSRCRGILESWKAGTSTSSAALGEMLVELEAACREGSAHAASRQANGLDPVVTFTWCNPGATPPRPRCPRCRTGRRTGRRPGGPGTQLRCRTRGGAKDGRDHPGWLPRVRRTGGVPAEVYPHPLVNPRTRVRRRQPCPRRTRPLHLNHQQRGRTSGRHAHRYPSQGTRLVRMSPIKWRGDAGRR